MNRKAPDVLIIQRCAYHNAFTVQIKLKRLEWIGNNWQFINPLKTSTIRRHMLNNLCQKLTTCTLQYISHDIRLYTRHTKIQKHWSQ